MPQDKLTDKQEAFAQAVASGSDQASAYRQAYNCKNMSDQVIYNKASDLRKNGEIRVRINELRAENEQQGVITRDGIMQNLESILEQAKQSISKPIIDGNGNIVGTQHDSGAARVALQALDQEAKIIGAYTEKREIDITGTIQTNLSLEDKLKLISDIRSNDIGK